MNISQLYQWAISEYDRLDKSWAVEDYAAQKWISSQLLPKLRQSMPPPPTQSTNRKRKRSTHNQQYIYDIGTSLGDGHC